MPVLNHHIVATRDKEATARYFSEILGLPEATRFGPFAALKVSRDTTLDFRDSETDDFDRLHYAFLVTEAEFDDIFGRIQERAIDYWSDPGHRDHGNINRRDGGRGLYFDDPNGHRLEILTRPYGSGGTGPPRASDANTNGPSE
ncbi:MAG: VOC family protein [Mycobacterium sp.]|uniref:VOC family protein n=1 Tax=Mycobacterium sp. TaxID=1785 RepID=UPI001EB4A1D3|nr:VOC family protein [Mycobacterium sp.]MBW0020239.1 VOC family protein [Mycobacterium sp.]